MALSKKLYTAKMKTVGGRTGKSSSPDGSFILQLAAPKEMGGSGEGVNPELLFAAGYSACFLSALKLVAGKKKIALAETASVEAEVAIGPQGQGFGLEVVLHVNLPGMEQAAAEEVVELAHKTCPYSNATRNNVDVSLDVTTS